MDEEVMSDEFVETKYDRGYGVHWMTKEEVDQWLNSLSEQEKRDMDVRSEHQLYVRKVAERDGKIPDSEWMKKL